MILRKSFYIRWSAGRSPRVHEANPARDPSLGRDKSNYSKRLVRSRHPNNDMKHFRSQP